MSCFVVVSEVQTRSATDSNSCNKVIVIGGAYCAWLYVALRQGRAEAYGYAHVIEEGYTG
jgi:hypothetical protein